MPQITVLPEHIANKIAAGEVVERPAAVVKELVENAIDAGSTFISVIIAKSGKELIQVVDNGRGMDEQDLPLAFERHATSKIRDVEDLDHISTLGFRGEALPSIASVSHVEVKTRTADEETGNRLLIDGGKLSPLEKIAFKTGSSVSVRNLFFNTPARRNFLRADTTEFNHILKWMKRFFLAWPQIHFTLIHNGEELFNLPAVSQEERIAQTMGEPFAEVLLPVREVLNDMSLEGFVCRPDEARGNSLNQFLFLNRRAIINRSLSHAISQGYGNLMERNRFPQYVMFLQLTPDRVDVNVHPKKEEVRFANDQAIYHFFLSAVRQALQSGSAIPSLQTKQRLSEAGDALKEQLYRRPSVDVFRQGSAPASPPFASPSLPDPPAERFFTPPPNRKPDNPPEQQLRLDYQPMPEEIRQASRSGFDQVAGAADSSHRQPALWQVQNRYIFSQIKSGLVIIDQQVAHERVIYEQLLDYLDSDRQMPAQQLLFPQTLELPLEDYLIFSDLKDELKRIGFYINELSGRTIVIESVPADVRVGSEARILLDVLDYYRENAGRNDEPNKKIAAAFANKNCIKSGDRLELAEMQSLVDKLFNTREPYFCPHGRPVIITLETEELNRRFRR